MEVSVIMFGHANFSKILKRNEEQQLLISLVIVYLNMGWVKVCDADSLSKGDLIGFDYDNKKILIAKVQDKIYATTDKKAYGLGDLVRMSGTLDEPVQGKTVRLDVYDPKDKVFEPFNETFSADAPEHWSPAYPRLSDIQVKPNDKGLFSYRFPVDNPVGGPIVKGAYKIEVTYGITPGQSAHDITPYCKVC